MEPDGGRMIRSSSGIAIPTTLAEWCDPARMALVIYDMQVGICRQVANAEAVIEHTAAALDAARSVGMRVAFTRHLSLPRAWMGLTQLRMAMAWQGETNPDKVQPWFLPDAATTAIIPRLAPRPEDAVFDKVTMSAFDSTSLGFALKDCGIQAIALAGIALEIGIEPTLRQAYDNGFVGVLIEDACGFGNREARDRSIATLAFIGDTIISDTANFCAALTQRPGRGHGTGEVDTE